MDILHILAKASNDGKVFAMVISNCQHDECKKHGQDRSTVLLTSCRLVTLILAMSRPGILIAVEGIDGAGKTTQVQLLSRAFDFAGESFVSSKEPTDGPWGQRLRDSARNGRMSLDDELHAFIEDRKEHIASLIQPNLDQGKIVILDRYFYSTIAYQGARGKDVTELNELMRSFAPIPDIVFLLDADPAVGLSRISGSRGDDPNEFETLENLREVRAIFRQLDVVDSEIKSIDAQQNIAGVQKRVSDILLNGVLKEKRCAKPWGCDGLFCSYRQNGECRWATLYAALNQVSVATSADRFRPATQI